MVLNHQGRHGKFREAGLGKKTAICYKLVLGTKKTPITTTAALFIAPQNRFSRNMTWNVNQD